MARISFDQAEKMSKKSMYFRLKNDGDSCFVQFMTPSLSDIPVYNVHEVKDSQGHTKYIDCLRAPDESQDICPLCKSGNESKIVRYAVLYDIKENSVKFFQRGNKFFNKLANLMTRYNPITNYVFEIVRRGAPGSLQTDYDIYPVTDPTIKPVALDFNNIPSLEGTLIMNMDASQMQNYLNTGELNVQGNQSNEATYSNPAYDNRPQRRIPVGNNVDNRGNNF